MNVLANILKGQLAVLLIFNFLSCSSPDPQLEREVLYGILPAVTDSMVRDFRLPIPLPPPRPGLNLKDSLEYSRRMTQSKIDYKKQREELEKDTVRLEVGMVLEVNAIEEVHVARFLKEEKVTADSQSLKTNKEFQLELERIKGQEKFHFKPSSTYLTQEGKLNSRPEGMFMGIVSVSNIVFDTTRTKGVLTAGYACGNLCGYAFRIYIELKDGEWNIIEMKLYEIS